MLRRWKVPVLVQHRKSDKDCFQKDFLRHTDYYI